MENKGDLHCEENSSKKTDIDLKDCIEKLNGVNISPPVALIEEGLDKLNLGEKEDKGQEKVEETIKSKEQSVEPECQPKGEDKSVSEKTSEKEEGVVKEQKEESKQTAISEKETEVSRSDSVEENDAEKQGKVEEKEEEQDNDTGSIETPCPSDGELQCKGPTNGTPSSYCPGTRTVQPNQVTWPSLSNEQPGGRRRTHPSASEFDSQTDAHKYVRVGPGTPVENDDNHPSIGAEDLLQEVASTIPQVSDFYLPNSPEALFSDGLPSPAGSNFTETSVVGGACLSDANSPNSQWNLPISSPGGYLPTTPYNHHQNQPTPPYGYSQQGSGSSYSGPSPSLSQQYSPGSQSYLSPYSNHTSPNDLQNSQNDLHTSPMYTGPDGPYQFNHTSPYSGSCHGNIACLPSPVGQDQGSPRAGVSVGSPEYSQEGVQGAQCWGGGVNSPDSGMGLLPDDGTAINNAGFPVSVGVTEQQKIHNIAKSLEQTAIDFEKQKVEQNRAYKVQTMVTSSAVANNGVNISSGENKEPVTQQKKDTKTLLREKLLASQREAQPGSSTTSKVKVESEKEKKRRGRPPGSKNRPKQPANRPTGTQPILPADNLAGPNVTNVIIISSQGTTQPVAGGNQAPVGTATVVSGNASVKPALVIPTPTQYQPILPVEKRNEEVGETKPKQPLVLSPPQICKKECKVSESCEDPPELQKKLTLKAERTVASIERNQLPYKDADGDTLLTIGVVRDRYMFRAFIERMEREGMLADLIDSTNKIGQTPLYLAVVTNKPDLLQLLLEKGANPNQHSSLLTRNREPNGFRMPLHVAAEKGRELQVVMEMLLGAKTIDVNIQNSGQKTPLHVAVESHGHNGVNSEGTVRLLLKHGAKVTKGPNERTPLHILVERQELRFLKFLVSLIPPTDRQEALNATDSNGNTCLHIAAAQTSKKNTSGQNESVAVEMIRLLLLEWDADLSIKNGKNETAKTAVPKENVQVLEIFREADTRRKNKLANSCYKQPQSSEGQTGTDKKLVYSKPTHSNNSNNTNRPQETVTTASSHSNHPTATPSNNTGPQATGIHGNNLLPSNGNHGNHSGPSVSVSGLSSSNIGPTAGGIYRDDFHPYLAATDIDGGSNNNINSQVNPGPGDILDFQIGANFSSQGGHHNVGSVAMGPGYPGASFQGGSSNNSAGLGLDPGFPGAMVQGSFQIIPRSQAEQLSYESYGGVIDISHFQNRGVEFVGL